MEFGFEFANGTFQKFLPPLCSHFELTALTPVSLSSMQITGQEESFRKIFLNFFFAISIKLLNVMIYTN